MLLVWNIKPGTHPIVQSCFMNASFSENGRKKLLGKVSYVIGFYYHSGAKGTSENPNSDLSQDMIELISIKANSCI